MGVHNRLVAAALAALTVFLCACAAAGAATSPLVDPQAVVAPRPASAAASPPPPPATATTVTPPGDQTTTTTPADDTTTTPAEPGAAPPPPSAESMRSDPGTSNAAAQTFAAKRAEAAGDCNPQRPPVNRMLAFGGTVAGGKGSSWTGVALFVAACFGALGLVAYLVRQERARRSAAPPAPRGALETIGLIVAIAGTLVAIGNQFVKERPPPEATMTVRDVLPRITREEYAPRTDVPIRGIDPLDRREVGNVVLVEVRLTGYGGERLDLHYALYSLDGETRGALFPATSRTVQLSVADDDVQTSFVPIWVGYPKAERFEAQFRLVRHGEVRQLADTGPMKGSAYRYACRRDLRAL